MPNTVLVTCDTEGQRCQDPTYMGLYSVGKEIWIYIAAGQIGEVISQQQTKDLSDLTWQKFISCSLKFPAGPGDSWGQLSPGIGCSDIVASPCQHRLPGGHDRGRESRENWAQPLTCCHSEVTCVTSTYVFLAKVSRINTPNHQKLENPISLCFMMMGDQKYWWAAVTSTLMCIYRLRWTYKGK